MQPIALRSYAPVAALIGLAIAGTVLYATSERAALLELFSDRWSMRYLSASTFMHGGFLHLLLNAMALHLVGGQMLLPFLRGPRVLALFAAGALAGHLANNLLGEAPAIGISAAVMGMLAFALYPFHKLPMRLMIIHDILRLRPIPLGALAVFIVALDITGIILDWGFFAHWAHLGGFAAGGLAGMVFFRRQLLHRWRMAQIARDSRRR